MRKTKWYVLGGALFCLLAAGLAVFLIKPAEAQTTSTTFPVDEAGIAAYVKVDNIEDIDLDALAAVLHTVERQAESYVIGTVGVINYVGADYPHMYIGMDGWLVAYYLNTEEASKIMQFKGWGPGQINTTILKDAIDVLSQESGLTYSATPIKYYDFEFPEANKLTLVAERTVWSTPNRNSFYVTIPGTLYEASYSIQVSPSGSQPLSLRVDDVAVIEKTVTQRSVFRGYYDSSTYFKAGLTHYITLYCGYCYTGSATVLIYKN